MAEFFDTGHSRTLAWARRMQAAALVAALADPDRVWDAIVIGEYERAFYDGQYASIAPLFEHYGIQLWTPEVGGRIDFHAEDHEETMLALGLQSKREIARTRIRVRTAMATQTREQGRYLGGRPPYGYRLADAGPHPNKAHAAWGRRAHRLEPDPDTAPVVAWMFAQRLAGRSAARITRALNDAGIPCPSAADPAARRYLLAGLLACGRCGRRLESAWSNGKPAYRCRHGHTSATGSSPDHPANLYVREDHILPRLAAPAILQAGSSSCPPGPTQATVQVASPAQAAELIDRLRAYDITLIYEPATRALRTDTKNSLAVTVG